MSVGRAITTRKGAREAAKTEGDERAQWLADVQSLMDTKHGRRVVWTFLTQCNVFGSAFNTNAMSQSHTIGWQDAGKWWLAEIEAACPEKYAVMANEARAEARRRETMLANQQADNEDTEE